MIHCDFIWFSLLVMTQQLVVIYPDFASTGPHGPHGFQTLPFELWLIAMLWDLALHIRYP